MFSCVTTENYPIKKIPLQDCKDLSGVVSSMEKIDEYRNGRRSSILRIDKMGYIWQITTFCEG